MLRSYIFCGNHEVITKTTSFLEYLKPILERLNDKVTVLIKPCVIEGMDVIPYTELKTFAPDDFSNDVLLTHVRGEIPPHVKPEVDLNKFNRWKVVLAGDLHSRTNSQRNILYPGSPLTVSFHRKPVQTGVIIFDTETLEHNWKALLLPQLIRKTVTTEEEMVPTSFDHTIYELTGNIEDLAKANKTNPLLDKKIVKRVVDSELDFSKTTSIVAELSLYLTKVKGMDSTDKTVKVYNDHV